jgi:hypothetical protein
MKMAWYHPHDTGSGYVASSLKMYRFLNLDSGIIKIVPDFDGPQSSGAARPPVLRGMAVSTHTAIQEEQRPGFVWVHPSPVPTQLLNSQFPEDFPGWDFRISQFFSCIPMRFHYF